MRGNIRQLVGILAFATTLMTFSCTQGKGPAPGSCDIVGPREIAFEKAGKVAGGVLLPGGVKLTPAGESVIVDVFPMNLLHVAAKDVLIVTNDGRNHGEDTQTLQVIDLKQMKVVQTVVKKGPYSLFLGLAATGDGKKVLASGGSQNRVFVFNVQDDGTLLESSVIPVDGFPGGLAMSSDNRHILVAQLTGDTIAMVDLEADPPKVVGTASVGEHSAKLPNAYPYWITLNRDESRAYVSNWGDGTVSVVDLRTMTMTASIKVGKNPEGMVLSPDGTRLYVANSDTDDISVIDTGRDELAGTITVNPKPDSPIGASPTSVDITPDGALLLVSSAGTNTIDVISTADGSVMGRIPAAWYPTRALLSGDGARLFTANAKGFGGGPNPEGEYPPSLNYGVVQVISMDWAVKNLGTITSQALSNNNRLKEYYELPCDRINSPIPARPGGETPIKHVIFIVKENKTYDQVFGDLAGTDADPSLVMFGEEYTPNMHQLAREFASFENFYADSEVSVQGHMWVTASVSNDFVEKSWLGVEGGRVFLPGIEPASYPKTEFFFQHLVRHKVNFRVYGEAVGTIAEVYGLYDRGTRLKKYVDENWPGGVVWSTAPRDEDRAKYFADRLGEWEGNPGAMPAFIFMVLPDDHSNGVSPGNLTPGSMVSDNDYALGLIVEAVSKSSFWKNTAIFVTEDDPQSGADHVDSHRTVCMIISPYSRRGYNSKVHYSFPSIHKTMELILGVPPMNNYDDRAPAMYDAFTVTPDTRGYTALPRRIPDEIIPGLDMLPPGLKGLAIESLKMDFSEPDSEKNFMMGRVL
ncbi:MAG: bifunctional YncE family protein/alkaline phosphatase family protein, partial [Myxococcota bacterium]